MIKKFTKQGLTDSEYSLIHWWLKKNFGKASKCESLTCDKKPARRYEWALRPNMKYERNRDNFMQLCKSCHIKMDFTEDGKARLSRINSGKKLPLHEELCVICKEKTMVRGSRPAICSESCRKINKLNYRRTYARNHKDSVKRWNKNYWDNHRDKMNKNYISKKNVFDTKIGAINYLVKNNVYTDEWSGTGMYEAIVKIVEAPKKKRFSKTYLKSLLSKVIARRS